MPATDNQFTAPALKRGTPAWYEAGLILVAIDISLMALAAGCGLRIEVSLSQIWGLLDVARYFTVQAVDALLGKREVAHYFNAYEVDVACISEGVYACTGILRRACGGDPSPERCGEREHHKTTTMPQGSTKDDWDAKTWLANEMKRPVWGGDLLEYGGRY
ncbi:uncharacterized protein ARMOST_15959 [Armillaria ostoyae]|uniref:Uncharacterized protein n=1 Tax=Armillaria ostoyae TaxID=47428 RepID=A0A284RUU4_ARMOS|nr:uncharacterized protein ARMOST_15959 [Armillaria ostoyae]